MTDFDLIIDNKSAEKFYFKDLWQYRELFFFLAWKDVLIRYKDTVIGVAWAVLRPLLTMLIMAFVFGHVAKMPSGGVPYPILVFSGLLPWQLFSTSLTTASESLIASREMVTKIYFPRLILPVSTILVNLIDFLISVGLLLGLIIIESFGFKLNLLALPVFLLLCLLLTVGCGLILSALTVKYRDFRYVVPFIVQLGIYLSPVAYSINVVPEKWRLLYSLNPLVGIISGFRWCFTGQQIYYPSLIISLIFTLLVFYFGLKLFKKLEVNFADSI
ncbi:MAG: O-antigen export system [Gammaproteobacteria bacterium]|nr:O-antigen export system [Gammaproteobacteria bacterium]